MTELARLNAADLALELEWLARVLEGRLKSYFGQGVPPFLFGDTLPPSLGPGPVGQLARQLTPAERLVLVLALAPHVQPQLLDLLWTQNDAIKRGFSEFGGQAGQGHSGFLPTGETAAFLIAGVDLRARLAVQAILAPEGKLARLASLRLAPPLGSDPALSGLLVISPARVLALTTGAPHRPDFGPDFPARRIETQREWAELILPHSTTEQLLEIKHWIEHKDALLGDWGMAGKLPPGFTALFHGPPGTGKTMSACLLGKLCGADVYRVDLSMVVSKYIGETEKNLRRVFDAAEERGWILFFDEADALFGQRTSVADAHDRYANQEVSFLLQRIETFDGVVVLASNKKGNIDEAFLRRFHAVVAFPLPQATERERIWLGALPTKARFAEDVNPSRLASQHAISGGTIMNVMRFAALRALSRGDQTLALDDLIEGIRREQQKEGRSA